MAVAIMTVNPRTETRAKNSKSGINSIRTREWRIIQRPEMKCRAPTVVNLSKGALSWGGSASFGAQAYDIYNASDALCLFSFVHFSKSCVQYREPRPEVHEAEGARQRAYAAAGREARAGHIVK
jgi:hypothetical protein